MENKGILHGMGGWSQFFFFFFLASIGLITGVLIITLFTNSEEIYQSARTMQMVQAIQTVFIFLLPSLAFAYLCQGSPKTYLKTEESQNLLLIILAILLIIVIQPFINCISYYNHQIVLPESMASFDGWIKNGEAAAEKTLKVLFTDRSVFSLILNLLVIAVVAGLAEEFFFRGCLQQIVQKIVTNKHIAVWITAIIFSIVHFQFYGFVPRVLLGALLGYLFLWSGSIWVPVITHTIHNAVNVLLIYVYYDIPENEQMGYFSLNENAPLIISSFILSAIILFILHKKL
ncbi:membrane protease YdiL (CAAX protease family) [Dysgonomonas sp. PFB1-18]|uniref:CPBP family intramembrane glutamic endopeptidase n=1 Tax=unclassified Dysgonomonas TaxID=2630389 RepID=UPI002475CD44|nr:MULTISPECIES: CPBP family intramembrane glutamic endopeptidase [unclassified Dysgonomonas]MDH6310409.1 membrane protease YdiL (CAAX protease family) [Dysgonomonas sp. PF1-14]MDH6340261.1 membrane protease YdiL (CAAX protease family) [Dysgonomonas sp. PF1-16]MDH6381958.1 membrane protease YdiL (CAAX protease family) [Dysgonomonas sp. PFB1-18]MDH6399233.1 membrane protease YdiL (CAAX protease family) [Dysgonomonas sp. PF1-23]